MVWHIGQAYGQDLRDRVLNAKGSISTPTNSLTSAPNTTWPSQFDRAKLLIIWWAFRDSNTAPADHEFADLLLEEAALADVTGASRPPLTKVVICSRISLLSFGLQTSLASCSSRCVSENAYM